MLFRGRAAAEGKIDTNEGANQLLEMAAMLESVDRAKAIEFYAKKSSSSRIQLEAKKRREIFKPFRHTDNQSRA
jgi:hypothetical protein